MPDGLWYHIGKRGRNVVMQVVPGMSRGIGARITLQELAETNRGRRRRNDQQKAVRQKMKNPLKQMNKWRISGMMLMVSAGSHFVSAQQLSLAQCVSQALKRNEQVRNSDLDVQASEFQIRELKGSLLPRVDAYGDYQYYLDVPSQYAPASSFGGPEGQYSKLTLGLPQTTSAGIQSSVSLYNQSVFAGLQGARMMKDASRWQVALTREDVVYRVVTSYYAVQVLQDNLARLEDNIHNLEKTVGIHTVLKENELVSDNEHNRLIINLENLRNQYEYERLKRDKELAALKNLVRMDQADSLSVEPFEYAAAIMLPADDSGNKRADLALQEAKIRIAEADRKTVVAGYYPTLSAVTRFSVSGYYGEFSPAKQINDDWIKSSSIGLSLKVPLFDGFQRYNQVRQKDITINKYRNTLAWMEATADRERMDARTSFETNATQLQLSKKTLDIAETLFASAQQEFAHGLTTTTELLNAQNDLTSARTNYSNALLNVKLSELAWQRANGTLMTEYASAN